ncbi:hypothetical protein DFH06DRAFT_1131794 [Mycena polygramma]|nr:hypothetical protein DFH06DRAFT_1131794 [Mycena polygramma]
MSNMRASAASRKECNGMATGPGYIQQGIGICKGCTGFKLEEYNTRRVRGVRIPGTGDRVPGRRCSAHAEKDQRSMNGKPSLSIKSYGRLIGGVAHKRIAGCRRSTCKAIRNPLGHRCGLRRCTRNIAAVRNAWQCVVGRYIHEKKTGKIQGHESSWHAHVARNLPAWMRFEKNASEIMTLWKKCNKKAVGFMSCQEYKPHSGKLAPTNLKPQIGHGKGRTWTWARHRMAHDPSVTTKIKTWRGTTRVRQKRGLNMNVMGPVAEPIPLMGHGRARPGTKPFDRTWWGTTRVRHERRLEREWNRPAGRTKPFDRTWWGTTRVRHERDLNVNGIGPLVEPSLSIGHGGARPECDMSADLNVNGIGPLVEPSLSIGHGGARPETKPFDRTWWGTTRVRHERGLNLNGIGPLVEPSLSIGHGGARPECDMSADLNVNGIGPLVEPSLSIGHGGAQPEVTLRIARWPSEYEGIQTQNEVFAYRGMGCRWPSEYGGIQTHGTLRIAHEANTRVLNPVGRRCRREGINLVV